MQNAVVAFDEHLVDQPHGVILGRVAVRHVVGERQRRLLRQRILLGGVFFFLLARLGQIRLLPAVAKTAMPPKYFSTNFLASAGSKSPTIASAALFGA